MCFRDYGFDILQVVNIPKICTIVHMQEDARETNLTRIHHMQVYTKYGVTRLDNRRCKRPSSLVTYLAREHNANQGPVHVPRAETRPMGRCRLAAPSPFRNAATYIITTRTRSMGCPRICRYLGSQKYTRITSPSYYTHGNGEPW